MSAQRQELRNSFDLLRLVAAWAVLYSHQHVLIGLPEPMILSVKTLGFCGVVIFFILSGWLISQSWTRDPRPRAFLFKRALRIFPALITVVVLSDFVLGPLCTRLPLCDYFRSPLTWQYLTTAFLWIRYSLPGVFDSHPYPAVVNGSLWTLPVECLLYLSVLIAGLLGFFRRLWMPFGLLIVISAFPYLALKTGSNVLLTGSECLFVFWWGVCLGLEQRAPKEFKIRERALLVLTITLLGISLASANFCLLIAFATGVILLAARFSGGDKITLKTGDLSYGVYIFAFPVQQALWAELGQYGLSFWNFLMLSTLLTFVCAILSWHLVEKRFMRLKPKTQFFSGNQGPKPGP